MNIDFQRVNIEIFAKRTRQQIRELKQALERCERLEKQLNIAKDLFKTEESND